MKRELRELRRRRTNNVCVCARREALSKSASESHDQVGARRTATNGARKVLKRRGKKMSGGPPGHKRNIVRLDNDASCDDMYPTQPVVEVEVEEEEEYPGFISALAVYHKRRRVAKKLNF